MLYKYVVKQALVHLKKDESFKSSYSIIKQYLSNKNESTIVLKI